MFTKKRYRIEKCTPRDLLLTDRSIKELYGHKRMLVCPQMIAKGTVQSVNMRERDRGNSVYSCRYRPSNRSFTST
jgi:hypothetical protein